MILTRTVGRVLAASVVVLAACSDVTLEVDNQSGAALQSVQFLALPDTISVLATIPASTWKSATVAFDPPQRDGSYSVRVVQADTVRTVAFGYYTGGQFAQALRVVVYEDSVVARARDQAAWARRP